MYQQYAKQGDMSDEDNERRPGMVGLRQGETISDDDVLPPKTPPSPGGIKLPKFLPSSARKRSDGFEKVTLLMESDEDEIL